MDSIAFVALLAWIFLTFFRSGFWRRDPVLHSCAPRTPTPVAIIVPARDEADVIEESIGSLLAQDYAGSYRVVLVDDCSSDGTAEIARGLPNSERLTILTGAARPEGWAGKLWAVQQGVAATSEDLILLTDADIAHLPSHLATLVGQMESTNADMVSEMVRLNCHTLPERALIPAFVYFFALLYPFASVNHPKRGTAAAAGGTVLIRRRALERIGGVAAIRGALIDDVTLAKSVKRGGRIWLGHSTLARSIRPYGGFVDVWRMISRSAYVQLNYSPLLLVGAIAGLALTFLVPPLAAFAGSWFGVAAWALMSMTFLPSLRRFDLSYLWAPLLPAIATFYMAATIGAAVDHHRGRGVVWKNRTYADPA